MRERMWLRMCARLCAFVLIRAYGCCVCVRCVCVCVCERACVRVYEELIDQVRNNPGTLASVA